jgi:hypothetical protein
VKEYGALITEANPTRQASNRMHKVQEQNKLEHRTIGKEVKLIL